jgi:hypothetical protein
MDTSGMLPVRAVFIDYWYAALNSRPACCADDVRIGQANVLICHFLVGTNDENTSPGFTALHRRATCSRHRLRW